MARKKKKKPLFPPPVPTNVRVPPCAPGNPITLTIYDVPDVQLRYDIVTEGGQLHMRFSRKGRYATSLRTKTNGLNTIQLQLSGANRRLLNLKPAGRYPATWSETVDGPRISLDVLK